MPGLTFVVPAFNEEDVILNTLNELEEALSRIDIGSEIIVVNDGSVDRTKEVLKEKNDIVVISHPINIGYGNAIKSGIRRAKYEWVGIVDADGTYQIDKLPILVEEMKKGFDMVVCTRSNIHMIDSFIKRIFRQIFVFLVRFSTSSKIQDPNSGFRIFKKEFVLRFFPFLCGEFSFTTTLTIFCFGEEGFVKYVPTEYKRRRGRSNVKNIVDTMKTIRLIAQGIIFYNPIKFYLLLSFIMGVVVAFPSMVFALLKMPTLSLYFLIWGISSIFLIAFGVLGDLSRMNTLVNKVNR